jgi:hypothetical protein
MDRVILVAIVPRSAFPLTCGRLLAETQQDPIPLSEDDHRALEEDGYVIVRGVLDPIEVAELRRFLTSLFDAKPTQADAVSRPWAAEGRGGGVRRDRVVCVPERRQYT